MGPAGGGASGLGRIVGQGQTRKVASMYAIKTEVRDPKSDTWTFEAQKTMYGGKRIAAGDTVFVFASENEGGVGLIACGIVTSARAVPLEPGVERQTPRVSITLQRTALALRRLGRSELKPCSDWNDGRPETELNFKFYRQATDKIVGLSDGAAAFLSRCFPGPKTSPRGPEAAAPASTVGRVRNP